MDIIRLLKRKGFSIRQAIHVGQALPNYGIESFYRFFHLIITERRELNINDGEEFRIINSNETPIYFQMPDITTIDIMGNKEVIIDTKGNKKKRISVLLTIVGDDSKLPAVLIFKGKIIEKEINGNILKKEIFCLVQVWKYIFKFLKKINKKCLLILDKAPRHIDNDILEKFKLYKTHYVYIPGCLTRNLHPLDIKINKVFKSAVKNEYSKIELFEKENIKDLLKSNIIDMKETREQIINLIYKVWEDNNNIKKDSITNSFFQFSIAFSMSGIDDENFNFLEKIDEVDSIYYEFYLNELPWKNILILSN